MAVRFAIFTALALCVGAALAQPVYRCTDATGKVTLSDRLCDNTTVDASRVRVRENTIGAGDPGARPAGAQRAQRVAAAPAASPHIQEITTMVTAAIAQGDYERAERVAVTQHHWEMIRRAKQEDRAEARADRKAKQGNTTVCTTSGHSVAGNYSGRAVCRSR